MHPYHLAGRVLIVAVAGITLTVTAQEPMPTIQNGTVTRRQVTSVVAALAAPARGGEALWVGWREPAVSSTHGSCSTWSDDEATIRGLVLDPTPGRSDRPTLTASDAPMQLEAGSGIVMLARVVDGHVERLRLASDDCPVDANGRDVVWASGISPAESVKYLDSLTRLDGTLPDGRSLALAAISAIGWHREGSADPVLDALLASGSSDDLRDQAARVLARHRGRHGYDALSRAIATEPDQSRRARLVSALAGSLDASAPSLLLDLARHDANAHVRAEAIYGYAVRAGASGASTLVAVATADSSAEVQQRAVSGLARLPDHAGVPSIVSLAQNTAVPSLRKAAVSALSRSDDPRAVKFLEGIVAR